MAFSIVVWLASQDIHIIATGPQPGTGQYCLIIATGPQPDTGQYCLIIATGPQPGTGQYCLRDDN